MHSLLTNTYMYTDDTLRATNTFCEHVLRPLYTHFGTSLLQCDSYVCNNPKLYLVTPGRQIELAGFCAGVPWNPPRIAEMYIHVVCCFFTLDIM